jgi:uncharacterized membrane protein YjjP (DUF1212 family)
MPLEPRDVYLALDLALRVGEVVLSSGAGAADTQATMLSVTAASGLRGCAVDVNFDALSVSYQPAPDAPPTTQVRQVAYRSRDYSRLADVDQLVRELSRGEVEMPEARHRLSTITSAAHPYPRWSVTFALGFMAAGAALVIGGTWLVVLAAFLGAAGIDRINKLMSRTRWPAFYQQVAGALFVSVLAISLHAMHVRADPSLVIGSGIVVLLAGIALVGAIQDALTGFYVTATARSLEAMLLTGGVIAGVSGGLTFGDKIGQDLRIEVYISHISDWPLSLLGGAVTAAAFSYACYAPLRSLLPSSIVGLLGTAVYLAAVQWGFGIAWASAVAAIAVGVFSYSLAGRVRVPPLVVVVAGIVPLLPGLTIYKALFQLSKGNIVGLISFATAATIAVGLAAGVLLGEYIAQPLKREARRMETRLAGPRLVGPFRPRSARSVRRAARRTRGT